MTMHIVSIYLSQDWPVGLLGSRQFFVKITNFTDFHSIFKGFSTIFDNIRTLFYTQTPTVTAPDVSLLTSNFTSIGLASKSQKCAISDIHVHL